MTQLTYHNLKSLPSSVSPSSHATEYNGLVTVTGQFARNLDLPDAPLPNGIGAQTEQTLRNLSHLLNQIGLTLDDVMSVQVYLTDFHNDYQSMNEVYASFFAPDRRPTRTCVGVRDLVRGARIEIGCVAVRPAAD